MRVFFLIFVFSSALSVSGQESGSDSIYNRVDVHARFEGGDEKFIEIFRSNFKYPQRCKDSGINGYVLLKFVVDTNGILTKIMAQEETPACPEFALEAMRVIALTSPWIPATYHGKKVSSWRRIPIRLDLD